MLWGCIAFGKLGPLIQVDTKLNSRNYISGILEPFLPFWRRFARGKRDSYYMQDNAPCHKGKVVTEWLGKKKIKVLDWPPQSLDLNPIEYVWDVLLKRVRKRRNQPNSLKQLSLALKEEWHKLPVETINQLIASLHRRLSEVKSQKGMATKY